MSFLGVKTVTPLTLKFSHLKEHKFRHGFGDTVSPMSGCNAETKNTKPLPFLFHSKNRPLK